MKKLVRGINIPIVWDSSKSYIKEEHDKLNEELCYLIEDGFEVKFVTSSTLNGVMYVYHYLEKIEA